MRRVFFNLLIALGFSSCAFGQYGLQLSYFSPAKDPAYLIKPTIGVELHCKVGEIDKRFKMGCAIGFASFKPTQDTFQIYGMQSGGNGTFLLPGKQVIHKYQIVPISFTDEFKILKDKKFSPFVGIDATFNLVTISEYTKIETLIEEDRSNDLYWVFAVLPKLGVTYELKEKWLFNFTVARYVSLIGTAKELSFWKPGIGITYYPD